MYISEYMSVLVRLSARLLAVATGIWSAYAVLATYLVPTPVHNREDPRHWHVGYLYGVQVVAINVKQAIETSRISVWKHAKKSQVHNPKLK